MRDGARRVAAALPARRLIRWLLLGGTAIVVAAGVEAALRARLTTPAARVPTSLYTRPVAWGPSAPAIQLVSLGPLPGSPQEDRLPVALDALPDHLAAAVLAVEDQRFDRHRGLDLRRIAGALLANLRAGELVQGGSTITQQLAKNLFLTPKRSPLRKLREAALALGLEARYDKPTILEAYLNEVYLGQDGPRAIHGVGAAARFYFGKPVARVTLGEAALLAGMIRAPNRYHPGRHPEAARGRRDLVLRLMAEQSRVGEGEARRAARQGLRFRPHPAPILEAEYFRDFALPRLEPGDRRPPARGRRLFSTLDAALQRAANRAVREGLGRLPGGAEGALVALDPESGDVLAMVGGRDYQRSQFNRAVNARRQPGSAFKPVVALAALGRAGRRGGSPAFTLASMVPDEPVWIATPSGPWVPANYDGSYRGPVTVREALEQSLNVPFARMGQTIGPARIAAVGRRLGIESPLRPVPSLALGSSEVTPLELTRAYGVLAAGGRLAELRTSLGAAEAGRPPKPLSPPRVTQVVDPAEAYLVTSALEGVVSRGTGQALHSLQSWAGGLAGKSGTTNEWRDAWFLAYTPSLVVGVWVGYDDGESLGLPGSRAALPIVARFLQAALEIQDVEPFPVPDGVETARVARTELGWPPWGCEAEPEVFLEGTAPASDARCPEAGSAQWWRLLLEGRADEVLERLIERLTGRRPRP